MKKLVYLGLSMLGVSKTLVYEFWYDYIKPKSQSHEKYFMNTNSFIIHIKAEDFYKEIADDMMQNILNFKRFFLNFKG